MKILLLFITIISLSSSFSQTKSVIHENITTEIPKLDVVSNSEIGVTLVAKESGYKCNAIKIINGSDVKMGLGKIKISNGDIFVNTTTKNEFDLYESPYDNKVGIAINRETNEMKVYAINAGVYFGRVKQKIEFESITVFIPNKKNLRQEFIYNGKTNTTLKFTYREFYDDMARPSFTQELVYDINESNIIGFRGLRIEVLNTTNTNIEYRVLSFFDK